MRLNSFKPPPATGHASEIVLRPTSMRLKSFSLETVRKWPCSPHRWPRFRLQLHAKSLVLGPDRCETFVRPGFRRQLHSTDLVLGINCMQLTSFLRAKCVRPASFQKPTESDWPCPRRHLVGGMRVTSL